MSQANFVNPGILGTYKQFNRQFETPIVKSRASGCKAEVREDGEMRAREVSNATRASSEAESDD